MFMMFNHSKLQAKYLETGRFTALIGSLVQEGSCRMKGEKQEKESLTFFTFLFWEWEENWVNFLRGQPFVTKAARENPENAVEEVIFLPAVGPAASSDGKYNQSGPPTWSALAPPPAGALRRSEVWGAACTLTHQQPKYLLWSAASLVLHV